MAEVNVTPELRFPEFDNPLNSTILGDIATFSKGKGISKADIDEDGALECIRYGELYTHYSEIIDEVYSKTNVPAIELVLSEANDVIIPASGETQIDIATASCVLRGGIALGGDLNIIKSATSGIYLSYYLNNARKTKIARLAQGISVVHLYSSQLKTLSLNIPQPQEQQKIASFLSAVDERIQLLQKKKAKLEEYKKGVMQKLFSQEIRFKPAPSGVEGDDNGNDFPDWEEKKLGEIGEFKTSSVNKKIDEDLPMVYLVNYMNVYRHETISNSNRDNLMQVSATETQLVSNDLKKGDILFTPSSETPSDIGHSVVIFENLENTLYSYHLMRFRPTIEMDLTYSHYFCNIPTVLKQISSFATGSTRFTISVDSFSKIQVSIPSLPEQKKIATFLTSLDESIESLGKEIEGTTTFKKGLLQKMFV